MGDQGPEHWLAHALVVPDSSSEGERALLGSADRAGRGTPTMALQVELSLEGLVHRFDYLAERLPELTTGALGLAFHGRADERGAQL
jgi:hypothetical protein